MSKNANKTIDNARLCAAIAWLSWRGKGYLILQQYLVAELTWRKDAFVPAKLSRVLSENSIRPGFELIPPKEIHEANAPLVRC